MIVLFPIAWPIILYVKNPLIKRGAIDVSEGLRIVGTVYFQRHFWCLIFKKGFLLILRVIFDQ